MKIFIKILSIVFIIALIIFFFPKSSGEERSCLECTDKICECFGFEKTWEAVVGPWRNICYGIPYSCRFEGGRCNQECIFRGYYSGKCLKNMEIVKYGMVTFLDVCKDKKGIEIESKDKNILCGNFMDACCCFGTKKALKKNEVVNWKPYQNEEYGFEIKYPKDFDIDYTGSSVKLTFVEIVDGLKYGGPSYGIDIKKVDYQDIDDWFRAWRQKIETPFIYETTAEIKANITSVEDIKIQGRPAKKMIIKDFPYLDSYFGVIDDGYLYNFYYDGMIKHSERKVIESIINQIEKENKRREYEDKYREIFNQIISTFQFLE